MTKLWQYLVWLGMEKNFCTAQQSCTIPSVRPCPYLWALSFSYMQPHRSTWFPDSSDQDLQIRDREGTERYTVLLYIKGILMFRKRKKIKDRLIPLQKYSQTQILTPAIRNYSTGFQYCNTVPVSYSNSCSAAYFSLHHGRQPVVELPQADISPKKKKKLQQAEDPGLALAPVINAEITKGPNNPFINKCSAKMKTLIALNEQLNTWVGRFRKLLFP